MKSFHGKLLRINLSKQKSSVENIEESTFRENLGGKGLGTSLLLNEVKADVDPLGTKNKIIFVTGCASDSNHPAASRYGVISKSPLTGIYAESYSGGAVAPVMKATGYDAIIIEGTSNKAVAIIIKNSQVEFINADSIWGSNAYEAEDYLLKVTGDKGAQALVIGPAGENMVRFACIKNNKWRTAGRTGLGAVMGSKKLKGIAFHGNNKVEPFDTEKVKSLISKVRKDGKASDGTKAYTLYGTPMMVNILNNVNSFPTRYWHQGQSESVEYLNADYMNSNMKVKPKACKGCFIACGKMTEILQGKYKGLTIEGPEYETIYAFGGLCCLKTLEEVAYLNDLCDSLGVDTMSTGNLAALTIEAGLKGIIKETPKYGDTEGIADLIRDIVHKKGHGKVLAEGIKVAAEKWGLNEYAIHVKGMEPAGYDPRILKGMGLAYATSGRGACHLRATFYKPELSGIIAPDQIEGKAKLFIDYEDRMTIFDTFVFCRFYRDLIDWSDLQELIEAYTGMALNQNELRDMANKITTMSRQFNMDAGITRADDALPPRYYDEPLGENGEYRITRDEIDTMVSEYYALRNWNCDGVPL